MAVDYLPWERPGGQYPDRDGKFIAVVPTKPSLGAVAVEPSLDRERSPPSSRRP